MKLYPILISLAVLFVLTLIFKFKRTNETWLVSGLTGHVVDARWKGFLKSNRKIELIPCKEFFKNSTDYLKPLKVDDDFVTKYLDMLVNAYNQTYDEILTDEQKYDCICIDRLTINGFFINLSFKIENASTDKEKNAALGKAYTMLQTKHDDLFRGVVRKHILALLLIKKCLKNLKAGGKLIFDREYFGEGHFSLLKSMFRSESKFEEKYKTDALELSGKNDHMEPCFVILEGFAPKKNMLQVFKTYVSENPLVPDESVYEKNSR